VLFEEQMYFVNLYSTCIIRRVFILGFWTLYWDIP